jgi:hypothetical protein
MREVATVLYQLPYKLTRFTFPAARGATASHQAQKALASRVIVHITRYVSETKRSSIYPYLSSYLSIYLARLRNTLYTSEVAPLIYDAIR